MYDRHHTPNDNEGQGWPGRERTALPSPLTRTPAARMGKLGPWPPSHHHPHTISEILPTTAASQGTGARCGTVRERCGSFPPKVRVLVQPRVKERPESCRQCGNHGLRRPAGQQQRRPSHSPYSSGPRCLAWEVGERA